MWEFHLAGGGFFRLHKFRELSVPVYVWLNQAVSRARSKLSFLIFKAELPGSLIGTCLLIPTVFRIFS